MAMSDLPSKIEIREEGPREGFQFEGAPIATARKIELINALSETGLRTIQVVSFVDPKRVPGMADADEVVRGMTLRPGVSYTGLWLNDRGLQRAIATGRLSIYGTIGLTTSAAFLKRNQNRTLQENIEAQRRIVDMYLANDVPVVRGSIMAAFGCNFEGEIDVSRVLETADAIMAIAAEKGVRLSVLSLADTMAWATPRSIERVVGAVRNRYPEVRLALHLHDTRGMAIANAFAGLRMGVSILDGSVAGLGGCPFAGHKGAAGNICTEDLVFMCEEMGITTGIDLEALCECARLAEDIVGHPLPGSVMRGGTLAAYRRRTAA
jgi:hydroxymethylglutaryl-CoA lyase